MKRHNWILLAACWATAGCAATAPKEINEKYRDVLVQRHDNYRLKEGDTIEIEVSPIATLSNVIEVG